MSESNSPPPRHPGELLEKQVQSQHFDWWLFLGGAMTITLLLCITGWLAHFAMGWRQPWDVSVVAIAFVGWFILSFRHNRGKVRALLLGARGEREVAAILDNLRSEGYRLFHQVPVPLATGALMTAKDGEPQYAADAVLVGPAGVFTIETKWRSEHKGRPKRIEYDFAASRILANGYPEQPCPLAQVTRYASGLGKHIRQRTGLGLYVRAVVVYQGANVIECRGSGGNGRPWVLAPHRLRVWLKQELRRPDLAVGSLRRALAPDEIDRISGEIDRLHADHTSR